MERDTRASRGVSRSLATGVRAARAPHVSVRSVTEVIRRRRGQGDLPRLTMTLLSATGICFTIHHHGACGMGGGVIFSGGVEKHRVLPQGREMYAPAGTR